MEGRKGATGRSAALSLQHLGKRFGERVAFEDISFEIGHGEIFGFLGPNGAGKTTTVRTLGTLLVPTSGTATVAASRSGLRMGSRSASGSRSCPRRLACTSG